MNKKLWGKYCVRRNDRLREVSGTYDEVKKRSNVQVIGSPITMLDLSLARENLSS